MGILSRFRDIMKMNINALMDKASDPEKTIDDYMQNLNSDLGKVKAETASVLADEKRAKRALDECRTEIKKLQHYASKSVEAGNEEEARKFLERKGLQAEKLESLQTSYDLASANAVHMKQMQEKLVSDIGQLELRRAELKGKLAIAKAQQTLNSMGDHDSVFEALEEKVNRAYDEAMAIAELRTGTKDDLDALFAQYEKSTNPEDELAAIKKKINPKES
ncbi:PspA/IM30 family protein [Paenibacillus polymyxa]|uniref:Phage-shock protein n=1 Tax=Paenibacillus polymyxa (strain SC2) TaxID=886882 RepID=E3ECB0_PAEPS|nr:PspA/IM30 family protein [Paenibacillus polymyxa]ADO54253.1 phage-shock protein [Paenibacillus polymyxa SC2]AJE51464.1 phage-shock protein [Paenibacillus polymyxa]QOH60124.1 PspA/IM30 family protein [Paenibacillus polymyxa]WPQ57169.1 PspA/IM30 family protein [Paenibacillus polymyxa]CCC83183.1 putative membrane-associated 30 kDa protein [Paenibacillus polymyxa M1]